MTKLTVSSPSTSFANTDTTMRRSVHSLVQSLATLRGSNGSPTRVSRPRTKVSAVVGSTRTGSRRGSRFQNAIDRTGLPSSLSAAAEKPSPPCASCASTRTPGGDGGSF